jgi:hypothetical protein
LEESINYNMDIDLLFDVDNLMDTFYDQWHW